MAAGPNLWEVKCRFTPPAGVTPNPFNYTAYFRVQNDTTAIKKQIVEAAATFDATQIRNQAGSAWFIVSSAERNDLL